MMPGASKVVTIPASPSSPYYLGDDLLTLDDVSKWLRVKPSWVNEQTRNRARVRSKHPFPFVKMAGLLRFSRMRIAEWLAENST